MQAMHPFEKPKIKKKIVNIIAEMKVKTMDSYSVPLKVISTL